MMWIPLLVMNPSEQKEIQFRRHSYLRIFTYSLKRTYRNYISDTSGLAVLSPHILQMPKPVKRFWKGTNSTYSVPFQRFNSTSRPLPATTTEEASVRILSLTDDTIDATSSCHIRVACCPVIGITYSVPGRRYPVHVTLVSNIVLNNILYHRKIYISISNL